MTASSPQRSRDLCGPEDDDLRIAALNRLQSKGGGSFTGIKLLLCENPLPPLEEAIAAAQAELPLSNFYTEPFSGPPRRFLSEQIGVPERLIHINAGPELILRQLFDRRCMRVTTALPEDNRRVVEVLKQLLA